MNRNLIKGAKRYLAATALVVGMVAVMMITCKIRDVDMATGYLEIPRIHPCVAGMLAQANSVPQGVLQLLR